MPTIKKPFVSIIVPNFNGEEIIQESLTSFLRINYHQDCFEIIVVDNGSTDNSRNLIRKNFGQEIAAHKIKLIELPKNLGAPAAYNAGIRNAREDFAYILKTDNDIFLDKECLKNLVSCFDCDTNIGIVGGKILYYQNRKLIHLIGSKISPFFAGGRGVGKFKIDHGQYSRKLELDAVNGCMMLVKNEVIERIGLMDERYFLYFDDLDWSLRAKAAGYKMVYCPAAFAYHKTPYPQQRFQSERWLYFAIYNSFYFMRKHYSGCQRLIFFMALHLNVLRYILGVFINNPFGSYGKFLKVIFQAYLKGQKSIFSK